MPIPDFIQNIFNQSGLNIILRQNDHDNWKKVLDKAEYVPFGYLENTILFQLALQEGLGNSFSDISIIIIHDQKPCAVWPLLYCNDNEFDKITGFGTSIMPPLFISDMASASKKNIVKTCMQVLEGMGKQVGITTLNSEEVFLNTNTISDWHYEWIRMGGTASLRYDLYVDLSQDIEKIKNRFRKSYKSLINTGLKIWKVNILQNDEPSVWEEFRQLHIKVSRKETRAKESWDIHYKAVIKRMAFLVYLRNDQGELIGGGLFIHSGQECFYGVGAYDRNLFDKPLGHVVQYTAIEEMKKRGLQWYKIGTRSFHTDLPAPSPKEISITEFKEGFATNIFPKFLLALHL